MFKKVFYTLSLLIVLMGLQLRAQSRSAEPRVHIGSATFWEASQHISAGASYRHYFGNRGWAIEPEYSFMTEGSHQDHMLIMNVVKDLTSPSRKAVLYMIMGGGIAFSNLQEERFRGFLGGLGWGMGVKIWTSDRFFIAPQFRIGREPRFRVSFYAGLALQ